FLQAIIPSGNIIISILWILAFFVFAVGAGFFVAKGFKKLEEKHAHTRRISILSIALCFAYAFIAEKVFGVADITGAYIAGLVLSKNHASAKYVDRRVTVSSYTMFAPIFFAGIGIKISFSGFTPDVILLAAVFVFVAIITKIIGCGVSSRLFGFKFKDALRIGIGMIARGEVALIVAEKGIEGGLLDVRYRIIVVFLVMVASLLAPILLKLAYKNDDDMPLPTKTELEEGRFE
ncbi:MAG: cation:proton antiporter, partial [Clostridia bacterium]|nr:cation:proton antiporter [Clostridia bacterium]